MSTLAQLPSPCLGSYSSTLALLHTVWLLSFSFEGSLEISKTVFCVSAKVNNKNVEKLCHLHELYLGNIWTQMNQGFYHSLQWPWWLNTVKTFLEKWVVMETSWNKEYQGCPKCSVFWLSLYFLPLKNAVCTVLSIRETPWKDILLIGHILKKSSLTFQQWYRLGFNLLNRGH